MLVIRAEQMKVFEQAARCRFEDEMLAHSQAFAPRLSQVLGAERLRAAIVVAITRAEANGLTNRGPIRLFIELTFLCGSFFNTDPQYPAAAEILERPDDQMQRAQHLHEWHNDYLAQVSGAGAVHVHRALSALLVFARGPVPIPVEQLRAGLLSQMERSFPSKANFVGSSALNALFDEAVAEARQYGFEGVRATALLTLLRFAFGHGCTRDPLYPWIAQTLADQRIVDPAARAARLEQKAITWLEHVVARIGRVSPP